MRLAIIGCGLIGQKRAASAGAHEITAFVDLSLNRAQTLAAKFGGRAESDWRTVLADDIDAVIVATNHGSLAEISQAAVAHGKHVLVEKPAGMSVEEVAAIAAAATRHNRIVKVGFNHRFHPAMLKAREIIDSGVLGSVMYIRGRYGHGGRIGYDQEWRCKRALSGGGELIDQGSHLIDLSRWYMGELSLEYAATPTLYWPIDVEDNCFLALRGSGGSVAWLHATWSEWKNTFSFEIAGRDGKLTIDGLGGSYGVERLTHHHMLPEMGPPETTTWEWPFPDRSWEREMENFADAVATGTRPSGDILDALAMHHIIEQAYTQRTP